jgi:cytochrome c oxidase subunit 4
MATGADAETVERADTHGHGHGGHASDGEYIKIALILAVITALEVAVSYIDFFADNSTALLLALMPMMTVKFGMVAWFFMHLKQDSRLFSRLFVAGIILAFVVYTVVLFAFDEFF